MKLVQPSRRNRPPSRYRWWSRRVVAVSCAIALAAATVSALRAAPASTAKQAAHRPVSESGASSGSLERAARPGRVVSRSAGRPLAHKIVGIDPGHNGRNYTDPSYIDRLIWNGREMETCNTTGTETNSGYTEARFNFNVATDLAALLRAQGAEVVMTRKTNNGVGPCVSTRAQIINHAHANVAIDIHADGGPANGRGFSVLEPVADGPNDAIIASSYRFAKLVHDSFLKITGMPSSTYDGVNGYMPRDDLAGLNLTKVPEVLIESGNMRNSTDAAMLVTQSFQRTAARALDEAITRFIKGAP